MNDEEFVKDPLDKVSGQLRKAVGQNRHELGGLRNVVSQMKRDRNRSVGLLSKKQQEFLKKQSKLLPAISIKRPSRKTSSQVIPLSHKVRHEVVSLPNNSHALPKLGIFGSTNTAQFNVLPPIRTDGNELSSTESEAKLKRMSDYRKECSSLQESLNNAHKFACGSHVEDISFGVDRHKCHLNDGAILSSKRSFQNHRVRGDICATNSGLPRNDVSGYISSSDTAINHTNRMQCSSKGERNRGQITSAENENEDLNNKNIEGNVNDRMYEVKENKRSYWRVVRENLGCIIAMNKESHRKYYEQLFKEIRRCRYIRKPKKKSTSTRMWYESEEESEGEES